MILNLKDIKWKITIGLFFSLLIVATTSPVSQGCINNTAPEEPGKKDGETTKEPVILSNGDMFMTTTDLSIPSLGPDLEIIRTHNSQVTSRVDGFYQEKGSGPWVIEDGEYSGHGDRSITKSQWSSDFILSVDMRTVEPGPNYSWETARVDFRYIDKNNTYYCLIHKNGTLELSKLYGGQSYHLANGTNTFNPLAYNTIRIVTQGSNIKVYINDNLEINWTDTTNPLYSGKIALAAFYCHAHFDNVDIIGFIPPGDFPVAWSNPFNFDDNDTIFGRNWAFNYGLTAKEYPDGSVVILREDGRKDTFTKNPDNSYNPPYKVFDTLTKTANGFTLKLKNGTEYHFDAEEKLLDITDRNLNKITLTYSLINDKQRPVTVTDASSRALSLEYGANGLVSKITDWTGRQILYAYDSDNNLISVTDPKGNVRSYAYNPSHTIKSYTDRQGYTYNYTYYYNNRAAKQTDPLGNVTTFTYLENATWVKNSKNQTTYYNFYPDNNQLASVVDMLGNTEYYTYDEYGNRVSLTDKNGHAWTYTYDTKGNMLSKTDPLLHTTTYTYEPVFNQIASIQDPKGNPPTAFNYDIKGNLTKITDSLGNPTDFEYDPQGNLIKTSEHLNPTTTYITTYAYDPYGNRTSVTDALGYKTAFSYDLVSRLTSVTDANNHTTTLEYDANDNIVTVTDALGNSTFFVYDKDDRLIRKTDPAGNITYFEYNYAGDVTKVTECGKITAFEYDLTNYVHQAASNKISQTDANGNKTTYGYDKENRLEFTKQWISGVDFYLTKYGYDKVGSLASITDANNHTTSYVYYDDDTLKTTTYPDSSTEAYTYDNNHNALTKKDRKGQIISYAYDTLNRLITKTYPDSTSIAYAYDSLSRLLTVTDSSGAITHTYDAVGRLKSVTYPNALQVSYDYDPVGNKTKLTYPDSTYLTYEYDALNRPLNIKDQAQALITGFSYDVLSRRTNLALANGVTAAYSYDALSNLLSLVNQKSPTVISSFTYTYDNVGNRLTRQSNEGMHTYAYDKIYQLTQVVKPGPSTKTYNFDAAGNRTTVVNGGTTTYTANNLNQYTSVGSIGYSYDLNGSLISDGTRTYSYDYENRLKTVTQGANGTAFTYDAFGRRISKEVNGTLQAKYIYDQDNIILDLDSSNQITAKYIYSPSIDEPLLMIKGTNKYYYSRDGLGSIVNLTDSNGNIVESYTYDEYGNVSAPSQIGNRYLYTGREYDPEINLYYYRARYYDPSIGRFLQTDPVGYAGGINLYTYVGNNPINLTDPEGLYGQWLSWLVNAALKALGRWIGAEIGNSGEISEAGENDKDSDGIPDFEDDSDGDGINDWVDKDDDNDGKPDKKDKIDNNPPLDTDGDGIPDSRDSDDDNDGVTDGDDRFPKDSGKTGCGGN